MRRNLAPEQWDAAEAGTLVSPDGRTFTRRTTRMKRKRAAELVAASCPVVSYWPGGLPEHTEVVWHDGPDAASAWEKARAAVTSDTPQREKGTSATAGLWETQDGDPLLLLTWHH